MGIGGKKGTLGWRERIPSGNRYCLEGQGSEGRGQGHQNSEGVGAVQWLLLGHAGGVMRLLLEGPKEAGGWSQRLPGRDARRTACKAGRRKPLLAPPASRSPFLSPDCWIRWDGKPTSTGEMWSVAPESRSREQRAGSEAEGQELNDRHSYLLEVSLSAFHI